jgi:hypothetical protein
MHNSSIDSQVRAAASVLYDFMAQPSTPRQYRNSEGAGSSNSRISLEVGEAMSSVYI